MPAFRLHAVEAARPLEGALDLFDGDDDHVEFYWFPHTDVAATKRNNRTEAEGPVRGRVAEWMGDELVGNGAFALACRVGAAVPRLVPSINRIAAGRFAASEYVDRSYRVFTSPRRVRFLEMEYAVPRAALPAAFTGLRRAVERHGQAVTFPVEVRVAAADDIPLSTASGRDSAYLAVHVHRGEPHEAYFGAVEAVMRDLDGRPHWGKLHTRTAADLRPAYPGFDAFVALRDRLDPERRFSNAYLRAGAGMNGAMTIWDLPTPALLVDADALAANLADMATQLPGRAAAPARQGAQDHRAGPAAGRVGAHRRSRAPPSARSRAWPPPGWARTCCWPTRCSTRAASACSWTRGPGDRGDRLTGNARRRRPGRGAGGARRRQRRPAAVRDRARPRRVRSPTRPARPGSPCAASWATRATS